MSQGNKKHMHSWQDQNIESCNKVQAIALSTNKILLVAIISCVSSYYKYF